MVVEGWLLLSAPPGSVAMPKESDGQTFVLMAPRRQLGVRPNVLRFSGCVVAGGGTLSAATVS